MVGHEKILDYFSNGLRDGSLSHAYLLLGGRGAGKMSLIKEILPQLLGGHIDNHPDLKIIKPLSDYIAIAEIRQLRLWLGQSPLAGKRKVAIIDDAQTMGTEAQNAFLKILEEADQSNVIFLIAQHRRQLLPTIISRSALIYFNPLPAGRIKTASNTHGFPGRAAKILSGDWDNGWQQFLGNQDAGEKMQLWLKLGLTKEKAREWLLENLENLRALLRQTAERGSASKNLTGRAREVLFALGNPKGQNWHLLCENLILSL